MVYLADYDDANMIAAFPFDEGTGAPEEVKSGNVASTATGSWTSDGDGVGYTMDGTTEHLSFGTSTDYFGATNTLTIDIIFKPAQVAAARTLIGKSDAAAFTTDDDTIVVLQKNRIQYLRLRAVGEGPAVISGGTISNNTLTHFRVCYDPTQSVLSNDMEFYLDDMTTAVSAQGYTGTGNVANTTNSPLYFGRYGAGLYFNGTIYEAAISDTIRTTNILP